VKGPSGGVPMRMRKAAETKIGEVVASDTNIDRTSVLHRSTAARVR